MSSEYRERSFLERCVRSIGGFLVGLLLLVGATVLLAWNEGDFVRTRDALNEALAVTQELANPRKLHPAFDGLMVHASGQAKAVSDLLDPVLGQRFRALVLVRQASYYQWVEHETSEHREKIGGGEETVTVYTYDLDWADEPVSSGHFHEHEARSARANFSLARVPDETQYAQARLGAYALPKFLLEKVDVETPCVLAPSEALVRDLAARVRRVREMRGLPPAEQLVHIYDNTLYLGASPFTPEVGDVRVEWTMVPEGVVSLLAACDKDTFVPYTAKNGKTIAALTLGERDAEGMYADEHQENVVITWLLRGLGCVLACVAIGLLFGPLEAIARVVPLLGSLVEVGVYLGAFVLGFAWSLVIIALAWIAYRPLVACAILVLAVLFLLLLGAKNKLFPAS